jgi:hypothetical protein
VAYYLRVPEVPTDVYVRLSCIENDVEVSLGRILTQDNVHVSA